MNDTDFTTKKKELEEAIALRNDENVKLKEKIEMLAAKIKPLKSIQTIQNEQIAETIKSINNCKTELQEVHKLIVEKKWKLIKAEIMVGNEEANYEIYFKMMENHKALSVDKVKEEAASIEILQVSCPESESSTDSVIASRNALEAQAAEQSINIVELQENITNEERRHGILMKRNAAALLKLRKELQQSELNRKDIMDKYNQRKHLITDYNI